MTVNVFPAIESVPVRWLVLPFESTLYDTEPFPLPEYPDVMWSQFELLDEAVQAHPEAVETLTDPEPPELSCDRDVGLME